MYQQQEVCYSDNNRYRYTYVGILEEGLSIPGLQQTSFNTFESNIPFVLRFMIDHGISGGGWVELPAGKYELATNPVGNTQIEAECVYEDLVAHPADSEEHSTIAPLRMLSFGKKCIYFMI